MERMLSEENCILAEIRMAKNKPDNRMARHVGKYAERYGKILRRQLINGYSFHKGKDTVIVDSYKGKRRELNIPCLNDQAAQQAWLNIASPYIERRNYYFNCGSIPGAGQIRSVRAIQKWLKNPKNKYAAVTDIRQFYKTCPHEVVLAGLDRIFKDKEFVAFAAKILASMSDTGVGLAIGHPTSHWFANVALMQLDHDLKQNFPKVKFTRYMDDVALVSTNKRYLKKAVLFLIDGVKALGMRVKNNWQVFRIEGRGLSFLSYRFFNGYTILQKPLMYRISRKAKRAGSHMNLHVAIALVSYVYGICRHCNSYNFRKERVYKYVNPKNCRRFISNENLLYRAS